MHEMFFLDIEFKGKKVNLEGWLLIWDYQHLIEIEINGIAVIFEPNDMLEYCISRERQNLYRHRLNQELLGLVAQQLTFMFLADHCKRNQI